MPNRNAPARADGEPSGVRPFAVLARRGRGPTAGGDQRRGQRRRATISTIDGEADDRDPVAAQPLPCELPRALSPRSRASPRLAQLRRALRPSRGAGVIAAAPRRTRALAGLDREVARSHWLPVSPALASSGGSSIEQMSRALGQRGGTGTRCGGSIGDGTSPRSRMRSARRRVGSTPGTAESSASVYGCRGRSKSSSVGGDLDDLAEVHDRDPVAHVPDDRQVVGDEDVGEVELVAAGRRAG